MCSLYHSAVALTHAGLPSLPSLRSSNLATSAAQYQPETVSEMWVDMETPDERICK